MDLASNVKEWIALDNQARVLTDQLRAVRERRNTAQDAVLNAADQAGASGARIRVSDGYLRFAQVRTTPPLSLRYVEGCLSRTLGDANKVAEAMQIIRDGRATREETLIKRTLQQSTD